ncbi:dimethylamine methyltransferase [Candidatus Formimonas warabiya]|uniref:Dimethylamine methyltransferase n=1 Tax=Formimonas warabiya TaxID=1761012 RepID=A0A3G1KZT4_FORW1|nr:dimethylamine methyltransferase [Candidatus Formimonas warabiya]
MEKIMTFMGDGSRIFMNAAEIRADLESGTADAADRGKIPELTEDEINHLFDIITAKSKVVGVENGKEIVTTTDSGIKIPMQGFVPVDRSTNAQIHERVLCSDTFELSHIDYSFKQIKTILPTEQSVLEYTQMNMTAPVLYGAMPNLGLYTVPDGPVANWNELLPQGEIQAALAAQEEAVEYAVKDMVFVSGGMFDAGADGIDFDTVGASGDADFLAALKATQILREKYPDYAVEMGMAGEFVLGIHGDLYFGPDRLAGLYPHQQVRVAEKAGVTIFGPVVNTNSLRSFPWNIARVCTFIKACAEAARIPIHPNVGMGVGGIPLTLKVPVELATRAVKAIVEIGKADGL